MNISFLKEKGNKYLIIILLGILFLVVIIPTPSENEQTMVSQKTETDSLELRLKSVLSSMEGVGRVEVMVTQSGTKDTLFGGNTTLEVVGVVVVAEGAGNATVNAQITQAVKALFSIEAHKISIVKMRS